MSIGPRSIGATSRQPVITEGALGRSSPERGDQFDTGLKPVSPQQRRGLRPAIVSWPFALITAARWEDDTNRLRLHKRTGSHARVTARSGQVPALWPVEEGVVSLLCVTICHPLDAANYVRGPATSGHDDRNTNEIHFLTRAVLGNRTRTYASREARHTARAALPALNSRTTCTK